ncbi:hypothetical protein ACHHYP_20739 [Achlya hypogyna]|uniref:Protein kinase domain-containing protein n=1 Tax=Achlya hypogyna TaxID=1202772 RepID=A0A1V9ZF25_ACHHY|nr:hypothetical protein ACHHYP_20739 [Achlya hypogyna]
MEAGTMPTPGNSIPEGWKSWARSTSPDVLSFRQLCAGVPVTKATDAMRACCAVSTTTNCAWFAADTSADNAWGVLNATAMAASAPTANTTLYNVSMWTSCAQIATLELNKLHVNFSGKAFEQPPNSLTLRSNLFTSFPSDLFNTNVSPLAPVVYTFIDNRFELPVVVSPLQCANLQLMVLSGQVTGSQGSPGIRLSRIEERGVRPPRSTLTLNELPIESIESISELPSRRHLWFGRWHGLSIVVQRLEAPSEERLARYFSSLQALLLWRHPHMLRILAVVRNDLRGGEVSTVVEAMSGGTLASALQAPWTWPEKLRRCYQIAAALEFAHKQAPWPRAVCLTSSRVLLDADGTCKLNVLDYVQPSDDASDDDDDGLSWRAVPWEAPEVVSQQSHRSDASDMYAFGVICCEIAMGSRPTKTWLHARAYEEDPTLAACPSFFQSVVFGCLEADPALRPSAAAVAAEFAAVK